MHFSVWKYSIEDNFCAKTIRQSTMAGKAPITAMTPEDGGTQQIATACGSDSWRISWGKLSPIRPFHVYINIYACASMNLWSNPQKRWKIAKNILKYMIMYVYYCMILDVYYIYIYIVEREREKKKNRERYYDILIDASTAWLRTTF